MSGPTQLIFYQINAVGMKSQSQQKTQQQQESEMAQTVWGRVEMGERRHYSLSMFVLF
jgi:hypothetical protein